MKLDIEIEGLDELLAAFKGVEAGMLDLRQLGTWKAVASEFRKIEKQAFNSEGGSGRSGKWKELSSPYKARKAKKWGNVGILTASGQLYRSLTQEGSTGAVYEESAQEMTIGTSIKYAGYHQKGTSRMPKREPISFTDAQEKQLMQPIQNKLKQLVANARLRNLRGF